MSKLTNKIVRILWTVFIAGWAVIGILFLFIATGMIGYMPPIEHLQNPIDKYASQLISADGKVFGSYAHSGDNRIYTRYNEISPDLIKALIATEDVRFRKHSGIDSKGLFRAVVKRGILNQKSGGGGSTITQQLAKLLYSPRTETKLGRLFQKPIEWVIAVKLERFYTKEEIITMYLNYFDFLYNAVGIKSAAYTYFGKQLADLKIEEAAVLVGMCKNPAYYNPVLHGETERCRGRRNIVLEQMYKAKYITKAECDSLQKLPLVTSFHRITHRDGEAPYFRERLRQVLMAKKPERKNYLAWQDDQYRADSIAWETDPVYGWCNKNKKADGSNYNIYTDGLKIYTTIDLRMQQYAEEAMVKQMKEVLQPIFDKEKRGRSYAPFSRDITSDEQRSILLRAMKQTDRWREMKKAGISESEIRASFNKKRKMQVWNWRGTIDTVMSPLDSIKYLKGILRTGFMAMNPHNGHIKAYVGGINFRNFQYDMVSQGRRQVGSTIKPFLYSLSMLEGISPCDEMLHVSQTLFTESGKAWTPKNAGARRTGEMVSIKWGLQNSSNWVTAYLMGRTSPYTFVRLLRSYGLSGYLEPSLSICLGTPDVSVQEMVSAYTTFVNKGIRVNPLPITRIEDQYGNVVAQFSPNMVEVLPPDAAYKMLYMLKSVVDGGTGSRLRYRYGFKLDMGGKTGTTQNNSDGWFVGFTPSLVAGCWVGGEDRSVHFDSMSNGQGAASALPIFAEFLKRVYADPKLGYTTEEKFEFPQDFQPCMMDQNVEYFDAGGGEVVEPLPEILVE